jgi:hypothetical protein
MTDDDRKRVILAEAVNRMAKLKAEEGGELTEPELLERAFAYLAEHDPLFAGFDAEELAREILDMRAKQTRH